MTGPNPHVRWTGQIPPPGSPTPPASPPPQPVAPPPPPSGNVMWSNQPVSPAPGSFGTAAPRPGWMHGRRMLCQNCGERGSGPFCTHCGEALAATSEAAGGILWEQLVTDRLHDLFALTKTLWLMLLQPTTLYRGLLQQHSLLAQVPFPLAPVWRLFTDRPQSVLHPMKFYLVAWGLTLFLTLLSPAEPSAPVIEQVSQWLGISEGAAEMIAEEVQLLLTMAGFAVGAYFLSKMLGGRISSGDVMRFSLYSSGITGVVSAAMAFDPENVVLLLTCLSLLVYLVFAMPFIVLPRLYGITRKQLLAAYVKATLASGAAVIGAMLAIFVLAAVVTA